MTFTSFSIPSVLSSTIRRFLKDEDDFIKLDPTSASRFWMG